MTAASLIITNARVLANDPARPFAEALGVVGNRIIYIGSQQEAKTWSDTSTRVIDAQGCTLLPGFIDSHFHMFMGSAELENVQLDDVKSLEDLTILLREYTGRHTESTWVNGSHLSYTILPEGQRLTRQHLDAILPDRPLAIMAYDYHTLWANTCALEIANILHATNIDPKGEIVIGEDGLASGELREPGGYGKLLSLTGVWGRAASGLLDIQPTDSTPQELEQERNILRRGLALAAQYGITSAHNMDGSLRQADLYASLEESQELTARIYISLSVTPETPLSALNEAVVMREKNRDGMLRGGLVKFFMDGVMESWTASLLEDYADRPGWKGNPIYTPEQFTRLAFECDRLGLQIAVHAIGDAAVRQTLDGFEQIRQRNRVCEYRHRIEHIELIDPYDLPRFAQLGVIASMQPLHASAADDLWKQRAGEARWAYAFAWQSLRQAGARVIFGSDWPVVTQNPLQGIHAALNRQPWKPGLPNQSQLLEHAIAAYTSDAAYAEFQDHQKGRLRLGWLADMVLLSGDLQRTPIDQIQHLHPLLTVCDGRIVYEKPGFG